MARFEAHITCDKLDATTVAKVGEQEGWVFSQITGCPLLGPGTYCYLTGYNKDSDILLEHLEQTGKLLETLGIKPLRLKIERIVYDTKTGVNELVG